MAAKYSRRLKIVSLSSLFAVLLLNLRVELSLQFLAPHKSLVRRPGPKSTVTASLVDDDDSQNTRQAARITLLSSAFSSLFLSLTIFVASTPHYAIAAVADDLFVSTEVQGVAAVTKSELGESVRRSIVQGAKLADTLDMKWERFSDSIRDEKRCDPGTNRRLYDNGFRRDGTRRNAPVLGALCDPVPLKALDISEKSVMRVVLGLVEDAAMEVIGEDRLSLQRKVDDTKELVRPAFTRATTTEKAKSWAIEEEIKEKEKQQIYKMEVYSRVRAYGEILSTSERSAVREKARRLDASWGQKIIASLAPDADRKDFQSPFPPPDPTEKQPYNEGDLLDALGAVSVTLRAMQEGGLIGHWEISIPEDDFGEVVTIAVDDDVSLGAQILAREQNQPLNASPVVAVVRSALEDRAKISCDIDTFFIDPTTTKPELYNPTQLLLSLSNLGSASR